jgi:hypothetical protein
MIADPEGVAELADLDGCRRELAGVPGETVAEETTGDE